MLKKIIALCLVLFVLSLLLIGCSKDESGDETEQTTTTKAATTTKKGETAETTTTAPETREIVNVTGVMRAHSGRVWNGGELQQYIIDALGVNMEMEFIERKAYNEAFALRFAANDLPDFMHMDAVYLPEVLVAGDKGLLVDYLEYMDMMPNFSKLFPRYMNDLAVGLSPDGKLFLVSEYKMYGETGMNYYYGIGVRKDILEQSSFYDDRISNWDDVEYLQLESWDDYIPMLQALKDVKGEPPMLDYALDGTVYMMGQLWGAGLLGPYGDLTRFPNAYWNAETHMWESAWERPNQKEWIKFCAKITEMGFRQPDWMSLEKQRSINLANTNTGAYCFSHISTIVGLNGGSVPDDENPEGLPNTWIAVIPPLEYNGVKYLTNWAQPEGIKLNKQGNAINAKCKHIDRMIEFVDWCYSYDGRMRLMYGEPGRDWMEWPESYGLTDSPFIPLHEGMKAVLPESYWPMLQSSEDFSKHQNEYPFYIAEMGIQYDYWNTRGYSGNPLRIFNDPRLAYMDNGGQAYLDSGMLGTMAEYPVTPVFTTKMLEEVMTITPSMQTYVSENIARMVMGEIDIDANWDSFLSGLKDLKSDRLITLLNNGQQIYDLKLGNAQELFDEIFNK